MKHRKYLSKEEVNALLKATRHGRNGERNYCMVFMAFRHGFRISELLSLKISDIDFTSRQINIRRMKNGLSTIHPFDEDELKILKAWVQIRKTYSTAHHNNRLFISERYPQLSRKQAWSIVRKSGEKAGICVRAHPHMLRHACGYVLANEGADTRLIQDYLGHRNIRHTVRYTTGNPKRFTDILRIFGL